MAGFSMPESLFANAQSRRILEIRPRFRTMLAMFKAHGSAPDNPKPYAPYFYAGNLVLRGRGTYTDWNGQTHKLGPGSFFQRLPGKQHQTWYDPRSDYAEFFIWLDPESGTSLLNLDLLKPVAVVNAGMNKLIFEHAVQLFHDIALPESELSGSVLLMRVLQFVQELYERGRQRGRRDFWTRVVMDACAILERDLAERPRLEELATKQKVEYSAFRKNFKRMMGMSPGEYRIRKRIDYACGLLLSNPVKQVAAELGYPDPYTFSTQFKTFVGMSPQEYKRNASVDPHSGAPRTGSGAPDRTGT